MTKRIDALDVLRGLTIAGMIMVNNQGSRVAFHQMQHSVWNGLTLADLVFPFFMFIMGISTYLSLVKSKFKYSSSIIVKILKRTLILILIGFALNYLSAPTSPIRYMGVMQRLGICYGITALLAISVNHKYIKYIATLLLVAYGALLLQCNGYVNGSESLLHRVDATLFGTVHMYHHGEVVDPEGLVSTLSAIAHVLIGFMFGKMLFGDKSKAKVFVFGLAFMCLGLALTHWLPINKRIWSPSFALFTCGLCALLLLLFIWIVDVKQKRWLTPFFRSFGVNPLFMYVFSELLAIGLGVLVITFSGEPMSVSHIFHDAILGSFLSERWCSLVYSIIFVAVCWSIGYPLYKHKIYIKI